MKYHRITFLFCQKIADVFCHFFLSTNNTFSSFFESNNSCEKNFLVFNFVFEKLFLWVKILCYSFRSITHFCFSLFAGERFLQCLPFCVFLPDFFRLKFFIFIFHFRKKCYSFSVVFPREIRLKMNNTNLHCQKFSLKNCSKNRSPQSSVP